MCAKNIQTLIIEEATHYNKITVTDYQTPANKHTVAVLTPINTDMNTD